MKNREKTEANILQAFEAVLVNEGFQQLKLRRIATEAKIDKVLIYRYFGGLEALATAYAKSEGCWPSLQESLGQLTVDDFHHSPKDALSALFKQHVNAIRHRPATLAILAWEQVEHSPLCDILAQAREAHAIALYDFLSRTNLFLPRFLLSFGAIFGATVNYLSVRAQQEQIFSGINIQSDEGWQQLIDTFVTLALSQLK